MYRTDPWLADFNVIPASMHDEFAAAAIRHGKAVEINLTAAGIDCDKLRTLPSKS